MISIKTTLFNRRQALLILGLIILALIVYLNRSYAHIYSYKQNPDLISSDIQRRYALEGGKGQKNIKYIALGDSLTYGLGASTHKETFPYILGQKLLNKYGSVEVINLAVIGAQVDDVWSNQLSQAIEEKPNFITIMIGTNDVHSSADKQKFRISLTSIIEELKKETSAQILLINIPYLGTDSLILPPYNSLMDIRIKEFNQVIQDIANLNEVGHFDLYGSSKGYFEKDPSLYSSDQFHPSDKGYILWGNLINAD